MRRKPASTEDRPRQDVSETVIEPLFGFIRTHWYAGQFVPAAKDRPLLLKWVILRFAKWLDERGVTLSPERYREILLERILKPALTHGAVSVNYVPAYLGRAVESHLARHGDEYYEEGKTLRNRLESVIRRAGASVAPAAVDPIRELAAAARLLKPKKAPRKPSVKGQLRQAELL